MSTLDTQSDEPGVYSVGADGRSRRVHLYQDGDYALADIVENFGLGRLEPGALGQEAEIVLTVRELRELKVMADAYSFDYEEGFIEMCLDLYRFSTAHPAELFRFTDNC